MIQNRLTEYEKIWGAVLAAVILIAASVLVFRSFSQTHFVNLPPSGTTWVAFGDSLTAGYGAAEDSDYPSVLGQKLGVEILNYGVSGQTSHDGLARIDEIIRLKPRVVLLCFGGNDGLRGLPAQQMYSNIEEMIDRLHGTGAFVVLIGIRSASVFDKNEKGFKELAKAKQVMYVPNMLDNVLGNPELMSDYIHPNEKGYEAIASRLEAVLRPMLPYLIP